MTEEAGASLASGPPRRIAVVGPGGAGKTTFAAALGRRTALPVFHLDRLFWKPGWVETPREEWWSLQRELVAGDRWIVDGNYGSSLHIRLSRADTIVVFDFPRRVYLRRALWRSVRNLGRSVQADGCPERLSRQREFVRWLWDYPRVSRLRVERAVEAERGRARIHRVSSAGAVRALLDALSDAGAPQV